MLGAAAVAGTLALRSDVPSGSDPVVEWVGKGCTYDGRARTVTARLRVERTGPAALTVTAYADENTSRPVGSRTVRVEPGARTLELTIPVRRAPHVDPDGVAACGRTLAVSPGR